MTEQLALLPEYLGAHLRLTLAALFVGLAISVPLGVAVTRRRWLEQPVLGLASIIQTIPSLALLAVMVPVLAAVHLRSIGFLPAFLGLVLYSLLPILRNTVTGIGAVDPAFIEAARGVGMTPRQQLLRVELPLAMPVIIAGVRTSTVWTVGVATLSTPVGATSLGNYIFSGLQTRNYDAVLVGCVASAGLALALDGVVRLVANGVTRRKRGVVVVALGGLAAVATWSVLSAAIEPSRAQRVVVGSKTFTEQYILSEALRARIESRTQLRADTAQSLGSSVAFDALRSGEIDVYVDYTGTIWSNVLHREASTTDRKLLLDEMKRALSESYGIITVGALGFENAYALAIKRSHARELGVRSISDLGKVVERLSIGGDYEFFGRPEWKSLQSTYRLAPHERRSMDSSLMYQAIANDEVDVISAFSTDGRIAGQDLLVLEDDRGAILPYDAVILASARVAKEHPEVIRALEGLSGTIDDARMRRMNSAVDAEHAAPSAVAAGFVKDLP